MVEHYLSLDRFVSPPVTQMKVLPDFSTFVTVFQRLLGLIIGFSEGVFGVRHCFVDCVQCFCHGEFHGSLVDAPVAYIGAVRYGWLELRALYCFKVPKTAFAEILIPELRYEMFVRSHGALARARVFVGDDYVNSLRLLSV